MKGGLAWEGVSVENGGGIHSNFYFQKKKGIFSSEEGTMMTTMKKRGSGQKRADSRIKEREGS